MDVDGCALHQLPPRHLVADQSFCPHSEAALGVQRIVQFVQYLDKSVRVCSGRSVHRKPCHVFCAVFSAVETFCFAASAEYAAARCCIPRPTAST